MKSPETVEPERMLDHAPWIRRLAGSLIADSMDADDAVQDTWAAALRRPPKTDRPVRPWLGRVLRNFAFQKARGDRHRTAREERAARGEAQPSAEELVLRAERQRELVGLVLELREPYRATILLRYYEGLEPSRIGEMQGVPASTVRSRVKRALDQLRERLDARCGGRRELWVGAFAPLAAPSGTGIGVEPSNLTTGAETMIMGSKIAVAAAGVMVTGAVVWQVTRWVEAGGEADAATQRTELAGGVLAEGEQATQEPAESHTTGLAPVQAPTDAREAILLAPAAPFAGRLIDELTYDPLPEYALRIEDGHGRAETVRTDAQGRFRTRASLAAGDVTLRLVDHPSTGERIVDPREVKVRGGGMEWTAKIEITDEHGNVVTERDEPTIRQLVLTHAGDPESLPQEIAAPAGPTWLLGIENPHEADLADATAVLQWYRWQEETSVAWTVLRDGAPPWVRFGAAVRDHMRVRGIYLEVRDASGLYAGNIRVEATSGVQERRVEIGQRARLNGRVVTVDEKPVADRGIVLRVADEERTAELRAREGLPIAFWTATDDQGRFDVAWIPPGRYTLRLVIDDHEDFGQPVELGPGAASRTFVVDPIEGRSVLVGRITSRTGQLEERVHITLSPVAEPAEAEERDGRSAKSVRAHWNETENGIVGHFAFGALPPGEYRLTARTQSFLPLTPEELTVTVPVEEEPEFVFLDDLPTRSLSFRAFDRASGDDIREFGVRFVLDPDAAAPKFRGGETGRGVTVIPNVPDGRPFEWRVQAGGWQPVWGDQQAFARGDEVAVQLKRGWGTAFYVFGPDEKPLEGTEVFFDGRLVGVTGPRGTLRATASEQPRLVRLVHTVDGEVRYVKELRELRKWAPTIRVAMEEDSTRR